VTRRWGAIAMPAVAVVLFLAVAWAHRISVDDAFINYRVVHQIEAGHGPVFNTGERVEVTTSSLWLAALVVADELSPVRLEWTALIMEVALGALGLVAAMAGAVRLAGLGEPDGAREPGRLIVPVGAVAYLAPVVAWDFATGGLENGLVLAWIGASFWAGVHLLAGPPGPPGPRRGDRLRARIAAVVRPFAGPGAGPRRVRWRYQVAGAAALVGLGVLVRPDLVVVCAGLAVPVAVAAWRARRWQGLAVAGVAAAALPAVVEVLRMGYYGQLFPNTVYAKEGMRSSWAQGWRYLTNFAGPYVLVVPVAIVAAWLISDRLADRGPGRRDRAIVVAAVEGAALAYTLAVVQVGGDYMHGRLLLAAWFTLLLPIAAVPLPALRARRATWPAAGLLAWAGVAAVAFRPPLGSLFSHRVAPLLAISHAAAGSGGVLDIRSAAQGWSGDAHPVTADQVSGFAGYVISALEPGRDLFEPQNYPPGPHELPVPGQIGTSVVTTTALGAWSYRLPLDVWVVDRLGLADPITARVALDYRATPGHEKALPAPWIAAAFVDDDHPVTDPSRFDRLDFSSAMLVGVDITAPNDRAGFAGERVAARAALGCGALRERIWDVRARLTPKRFVGNMVDAVRLDRFRFPSDPVAARRRLCG
jgi:arabinofuranosyltransferase